MPFFLAERTQEYTLVLTGTNSKKITQFHGLLSLDVVDNHLQIERNELN